MLKLLANSPRHHSSVIHKIEKIKILVTSRGIKRYYEESLLFEREWERRVKRERERERERERKRGDKDDDEACNNGTFTDFTLATPHKRNKSLSTLNGKHHSGSDIIKSIQVICSEEFSEMRAKGKKKERKTIFHKSKLKLVR